MTDKGNNEAEVEIPQDKLAFNELLKKFKIGLKGDFYETITDDIATTGGEMVFEKPDLLANKLLDWHSHIDGPTRRKLLKYWFTQKGVTVPEEIEEEAGMTTSEREKKKTEDAEKEEAERRRSEKYSVDRETGDITVATKDEPNPLSWGEAEKLSSKIKKSIEDREKKEAKAGEGDKEPPFTIDSEGNWQLNPKAKIGGMELLAFEAVRKSGEQGESLDPFEVMKERARDVETMRTVFGAGGGGGGLSELTETLLKLKELTGADEDTKNLLAGIYKKLSEGGEGKGESEEVKGLSERVDKLVAELQQKELEKRDEQIERITTELSNLRGEIARQSEKGKATDEYGIMSEGLRVVDRRLGAIESTIQGIFGKRPGLLPAGQRKEITEAIGEEAKGETELDQLAEVVFYK